MFLVEYFLIFRIGEFEIKDKDTPLRYLTREKDYLKVVFICWAAFSSIFWFVILFLPVYFDRNPFNP